MEFSMFVWWDGRELQKACVNCGFQAKQTAERNALTEFATTRQMVNLFSVELLVVPLLVARTRILNVTNWKEEPMCVVRNLTSKKHSIGSDFSVLLRP
jgi:Zn ribbon nucleic-acid-binding protein